jgi:hypothetical protein
MGPTVIWVLVALAIGAESPVNTPPSRYAPVADLARQVDYWTERIEEDLSDRAAYGEDQQGRVQKNASTLAAIGLVIGNHDTEHALKKSSRAMIAAAASLAANANDLDKAKAALAAVQAAPASPADDMRLAWEPVADLGILMQQVPIVNNNLRRAVTSRRFAQTIDQTAGLAAALAAIAQASMVDTAYCEDEERERQWQSLCAELRDAAAAVNVAVRRNDQAAAREALAQIIKTCDACHHVFRDGRD